MTDIAELPPKDHNAETAVIGDQLAECLQVDHASLLERLEQLTDAERRMPAITDDECARKVSDYIDLLGAVIGAAKQAHKDTKDPYLTAGRQIDEFFFRGITEPADAVKKRAAMKLKAFLDARAAAERKAREDAERLAKAEADRLAREAAAAASRLRTEQDLATAIEAEAAANAAKVEAVKATQAAAAPNAELARVKGTVGKAKSLKTFWDFADLDRDSLDLEKLRPYLPLDGLEKAMRAYIAAGGRTLDGARIFENTRI